MAMNRPVTSWSRVVPVKMSRSTTSASLPSVSLISEISLSKAACDLIAEHYGRRLDLASDPAGRP